MAEKTVGRVAAMTGVSVRTLHHYDEIGLLEPSARSEQRYRLYDDDDLVRLQEILLWRSLGFPLDEVRALLDDENRDRSEALRLQRAQLLAQVGELHERLDALDATLAKLDEGSPMQASDWAALFDGFDPTEFDAEAEARWGDTDAWAQSKRRTKHYGPKEWAEIKAEAASVSHGLAEVMAKGLSAESPQARELAMAHRAHISRWFYECTPEIHAGLAEMYVADARFAATYDAVAPGLALFVHQAIQALYVPRSKRL